MLEGNSSSLLRIVTEFVKPSPSLVKIAHYCCADKF